MGFHIKSNAAALGVCREVEFKMRSRDVKKVACIKGQMSTVAGCMMWRKEGEYGSWKKLR